jgi:ABC-type ATPase involved in cell division
MSGLDSARATSFLQVCAEKLSEGVGMLIVTHAPEAYNSLPHLHLELRDGILWELE